MNDFAEIARPFLQKPAHQAALAILVVALFMVLGALFFEHVLGYLPCELCYVQRKPWYFLASFGLLLLFFASNENRLALRLGLAISLLALLVSAGLGVWHAGIEWKWWAGPASCTASGLNFSFALPSLDKRVVLCDEAPLRILGLSLAGWNAVFSILLAFFVARGLLKTHARQGHAS